MVANDADPAPVLGVRLPVLALVDEGCSPDGRGALLSPPAPLGDTLGSRPFCNLCAASATPADGSSPIGASSSARRMSASFSCTCRGARVGGGQGRARAWRERRARGGGRHEGGLKMGAKGRGDLLRMLLEIVLEIVEVLLQPRHVRAEDRVVDTHPLVRARLA